MSNKCSFERPNPAFKAQNLTPQIKASYNTRLSKEDWELTERFQSSTVYEM